MSVCLSCAVSGGSVGGKGWGCVGYLPLGAPGAWVHARLWLPLITPSGFSIGTT